MGLESGIKTSPFISTWTVGSLFSLLWFLRSLSSSFQIPSTRPWTTATIFNTILCFCCSCSTRRWRATGNGQPLGKDMPFIIELISVCVWMCGWSVAEQLFLLKATHPVFLLSTPQQFIRITAGQLEEPFPVSQIIHNDFWHSNEYPKCLQGSDRKDFDWIAFN